MAACTTSARLRASLGFVNPAPGTLPISPPFRRAGLWRGHPGGLRPGHRQSHRLVLQQTAGRILAGFLACAPQCHLELWRALRRGIPAQVQAADRAGTCRIQLPGIAKGIQTDTNNIQPRIGVAWDPKGDGKTVVRASFGMFYDHPLLGLYFLGDASDASTSGQLAFPGGTPCSAAPPHSVPRISMPPVFSQGSFRTRTA